MADIIPFQKTTQTKKQSRAVPGKKDNMVVKPTSKKQSGNTLCKSGFHKWKVDNNTDFAVKQGKLLTSYTCERCGKTKTETR